MTTASNYIICYSIPHRTNISLVCISRNTIIRNDTVYTINYKKSVALSLKMKILAQLHVIITPNKKLFSYIHHKLFIAWLLSLLFSCIYHQGAEQKANSLFHVRFLLQVVRIFPLSIFPNLLYRSARLKVHLFQLANDLFWAVGKYLSQLVLVLKSLRDGAEGSAKSISLSENGDMIYAGCAATPLEQEDLAQPWKDEYTLLKIS